MAYTPKTWIDYPNTTTPITAAELNNIDEGVRSRFICTSSTRPSTPFDGQKIYETDTDLEYVWDGSAWVPAGGVMTSWTPTLTLTGLTPTYDEQVGLYKVEGDVCTANFTIRINSYSGSHGIPYDWVISLPEASSIASGYTQDVGLNLPGLHVYPIGYGIASCSATFSSQNILFALDSTTSAIMLTANHGTNTWSPSPTFSDPEVMVTGTLLYTV